MSSDRGSRLLKAFFASPNELQFDELEGMSAQIAGGALHLFNQLIEDARARDGRPVLLPRVDGEGTFWYALMPNRRVRRMIAEDVKAFVGATYADLEGMSAPLDGNDPIDAAALEWLGDDGASLRFRVPVAHRRAATEAIAEMRRAWDERPRHLISESDGTAVMLRALNRAIASGDSGLAEAALDRVRASGRLSSANVTFATIRVLEVGGRWAEMLKLDEIGVVLSIPRPRAVTEAVLRAVYWTEVADDIRLGQIPGADELNSGVAAMRDVILPRYGALFRAAEGLVAGEVLLLFALRTAAATRPRPKEIEQLAGKCAADNPAQTTIEAIAQRVRDTSEVEALPSSDSAFAADAVKAELRRVTEARRGRISEAQGSLEAFARGTSFDTASVALAALVGLSPEEEEELGTLHRYQPVITRLQALVPPGESHMPNDWASWARGLRTSPEWVGASDLVDLAAESWDIDPLLDNAVAEDFALTLMDARLEGGRGAAARALDHLVPAAEAAASRRLDVTPLGTRLVTILLADDVVSEADWNFVIALLDAVLDGLDGARYSQIIDEIRSALVDRASPAMLESSLATLEMVAFHHAPDPTARDSLAGVIIGICERFSHRLHRDQLAILEIACRDLGGGYENQAHELADRLLRDGNGLATREESLLEGQFIGIYSLEEPAAARAKAAIEAAYTGVRVETSAAEVATQGLRRLAQTADQMIVATRAAKHAATLEIDVILRKRGLRPVFPAGKGATSIVRALRERIAEL